jgi:hypothetical protein
LLDFLRQYELRGELVAVDPGGRLTINPEAIPLVECLGLREAAIRRTTPESPARERRAGGGLQSGLNK